MTVNKETGENENANEDLVAIPQPSVEPIISNQERVPRPMNSYFIFCKVHRNIVKKKFPNAENRLVSKLLGDWWRALTLEQKEPYEILANHNKDNTYARNPDFKWIKKPPPVKMWQPRRKQSCSFTDNPIYESENNNNTMKKNYNTSKPMEKIINNFSTFKLADEAQMGSLNSLIKCTSEDNSQTNNQETTIERKEPVDKDTQIKNLQLELNVTKKAFENEEGGPGLNSGDSGVGTHMEFEFPGTNDFDFEKLLKQIVPLDYDEFLAQRKAALRRKRRYSNIPKKYKTKKRANKSMKKVQPKPLKKQPKKGKIQLKLVKTPPKNGNIQMKLVEALPKLVEVKPKPVKVLPKPVKVQPKQVEAQPKPVEAQPEKTGRRVKQSKSNIKKLCRVYESSTSNFVVYGYKKRPAPDTENDVQNHNFKVFLEAIDIELEKRDAVESQMSQLSLT